MKVRVLLVGLCIAALGAWMLPAAGAQESSLANLDPGELASLEEDVLVQYVFVGYEPEQVDEATFLSGLPGEYRPIVRSRLFYDIVEYLGITYTYQYDVTYADDAFEDAFFTALPTMGTPSHLTKWQNKYNQQRQNLVRVRADNNLFIDAPSVEKWLIDNAPAGVDTERNTVFFINWWGRDDFRFHVYTKFGEPDPDTGYDFGVNRASRKLIAWGGTTPDDEETGLGSRGVNRVWFYDLSAGPEAWTSNWVVDQEDLFGSPDVEYRMPPIWEYASNGYRDPSALAGDLSKVARYVAIDLLFTTSPSYPPALTPLRLPDSINLDINTVNGWPEPGVDPSEAYQTLPLLLDELGELDHVQYSADVEDFAYDGKARQCFEGWAVDRPREPCYPRRTQYPIGANLFLYAALNREALIDGAGADYEGVLLNYATADAATPLGYADDNWVDGTQSFVVNFVSPGIVEAGYGLTTTQIHEFGHHIGMSHPHDGFDYEDFRDFGPGRDLFFAWSGDQSNSIMSYIDVNWDFSQFDRDNFDRFRAAAYLTNANAIAQLVLASPDAGAAAGALAQADAQAGAAEAAFAAHEYLDAFNSARSAYLSTLDAAELANVTVTPGENGWVVLPPPADDALVDATPDYVFVDRYRRIDRRALP